MHEERNNKHENEDAVPAGAIPGYLMDRQGVSRAKVSCSQQYASRRWLRSLFIRYFARFAAFFCIFCFTAQVLSNTVKQKRKEKAGKWSVPLPKVRAIADDEMFKILKSGKRRSTLFYYFKNEVVFGSIQSIIH